MAIPLIVAMAGTAISAWSSMEAGKAEAGAFEDSAFAKRRRANSVMERFDINAEFTRLEGKSFKGKQLAAFAGGGVDIGSGAALSAMEDTANKIERRIEIDKMEAESNRDSLLMAADLDIKSARAAEKGGQLGALSSVTRGFMMGSS